MVVKTPWILILRRRVVHLSASADGLRNAMAPLVQPSNRSLIWSPPGLEAALDFTGASDLYSGQLWKDGFFLVRRTQGTSVRAALRGEIRCVGAGTDVALSTGFDVVSLFQFLLLLLLPIALFLDFSSSVAAGSASPLARALGVAAWVVLIAGYFGIAAKYAERRFLRRLDTLCGSKAGNGDRQTSGLGERGQTE